MAENQTLHIVRIKFYNRCKDFRELVSHKLGLNQAVTDDEHQRMLIIIILIQMCQICRAVF